jgi:hypothetical protein
VDSTGGGYGQAARKSAISAIISRGGNFIALESEDGVLGKIFDRGCNAVMAVCAVIGVYSVVQPQSHTAGVSQSIPANAWWHMSAPWWAWALIAIAAVSLVLSGYRKFSHRFVWRSRPPVPVTGRTFINERITLDGNEFSHCDFTNVTFVYNGTAAIKFHDNAVHGRIQFDSDNPSVTSTMIMLAMLNALRPDFELLNNTPMRLERARELDRE